MGRKVSIILVLAEITFLSTVLFEGQMGDAAVFHLNHNKPNTAHVEWVSHDDCFHDVKVYEDPRPYYTREERTAAGNFQQTIMVQVVKLSSLISLALGIFVIDHMLASQESVEKTFKITSTAGGERKMRLLLSSTVNIILTMVLLQPQLISCVSGDASSAIDQNCTRKCGDVNVPYPFGFNDSVGEGCFRDNFYLTCNETYNPPRTYWGFFQVVEIKPESSQMRVFMPISYDCYNISGRDAISTWWTSLGENTKFSDKNNVYVAIGCDTNAYLNGTGTSKRSYTSGCISICQNKESVLENSCSGMGCCQASIPPGLQYYQTVLKSDNDHKDILDFNRCSYAFLVEKNNYTFDISDLKSMDKERRFPIVLDWSIGNQNCEEAQKSSNYACMSKNSDCFNSTDGDNYICNCSPGYLGNPYLQDGCQDIDECQYPNIYACNGTCTNILGSYNCSCPEGTTGDPKTYGCVPIPHQTKTQVKVLILVLLISSLGSVAIGVFIYALIQRRRLAQLRHKYFLQNGGAILEQQISTSKGMEKRFKLFTMEEIEKATDKFDERRILGRGGQGIVYEGTFSNGNDTYAIKKSSCLDGSKVEEFVNEMVILSQINHRNVVKLLGCCLEEENPLLVYEFVPNGTLFQHIRRGSITWDARLKIGTEIAGAFGYLHSSISVPIIHGDVKSSNILLGNNYTAKVSDFGASRFIPVDEIQVNTLVQGTLGYLDPEYLQTHELTDKSDVYSFGVVLVELLTGKTPLSSGREGEPKTLATYFLSFMEEDGSINKILDDRIAIDEGSNIIDEMKQVANIARRCLNLKGKDRPSMMEVAMELQRLRRVESHPWHPQNVEMATQELLVYPSDISSSTDMHSIFMQSSEENSMLANQQLEGNALFSHR